MKKLRMLAVLLLAIGLLLCAAAHGEEQGAFYYDANNWYLSLRGDLSGDVEIPSMVDDYYILAIGSNAFYEQHGVTSLTMPDTLYVLQDGAISRMNALNCVTLNEGLEVIGTNNFSNCPSLTSLTIPASVRMIEAAIGSCDNLREITFEGECPLFLDPAFCFFMMPEDYVIYVPEDQMDAYAAALADCNGAAEHIQSSGKPAVIPQAEDTSSWYAFDETTGTITGYNEYHAYIEIPSTINGVAVKAIGESAFRLDYSVYGAVLPEGLERVENSAFEMASNIDYIHFPTTLRFIGDRSFYNVQSELIEWNEGLEAIGTEAFCYDQTEILTLPSTVTAIGASAFEGSRTNELYLSGSLQSIGSRAFANCSLTYLVFDFYTPIDVAPDAFVENNYLADLDLPWDSSFENRDAYAALLAEQCPDCTVWISNPRDAGVAQYPEDETYTLEEGVWSAYNGSAADLTVWTSNGGVNITALGNGLFKGNQSIRSFYPHHCGWFTTIGSEAFADSSVSYVELFPSITTIGERAFANCAGIEDLTIPASVTSIGAGAFDGMTGLKKLTVLCDASLLPEGSFANCANLTDVTVAQGAIPARLFENSGVTTLTLGEGVTAIGENAFANTALNTVELKSVTDIGAGAFKDTALVSVDLTQAASIGESAFEGAALESVALNPAASVGERAFANTGLTQLVIPADGSFPLSAVEGTSAELRLSAGATDEQIAAWNETLNRPWYDPIVREGEESRFVKMPFEPTSAENFEFDSENGLISAYIGTDVDVVVPREIDGVTVVGFANYNVFESCRDYTNTDMETNQTDWVHLRTLVLPETIKELPDSLLSYCQQLETFVCYAPLETTGSTQFMLCRSLNNVIFVNGVRNIDNYAFDSAGSLGNLYFGEHMDRIGQQAFGFTGLTSFVADAESVEYGAFTECQSLTSLHFTGKVKSLGENCIIDCPNLAEICFDGCDLTTSPMGLMMNVAPQLTVHVPEGTSEENLNHAQNCVSWNSSEVEVTVITEACAHVLPERPDVPALLAGLKLDASMETTAPASAAVPETTAEPSAAPEAQTAAIPEEYLGAWYGVSIAEDGETYALADFGLEMTLTIGADGTATLDMNGEADTGMCAMQDGVLTIDGAAVTVENGEMVYSQDGATITLSREKPEIVEAYIPAIDETAALDDFIGIWTVTGATMDGMTLSPEILEMTGDTLTIYGDACDLTMQGMALDNLSCIMRDYALIVTILDGEAAITLREDGSLGLEMSDMTLWYERTGDAAEAPAIPTVPEATADSEAPAPQNGATDLTAIAEKKYVMTDADMNGYNMTAETMGGYEYSLVFHEDGSVDFVMAGTAIPMLKWNYGKVPTADGSETDGIVIDFSGQALNVVPTDKGFDMDYFGSMLMHFAPEDSAQ